MWWFRRSTVVLSRRKSEFYPGSMWNSWCTKWHWGRLISEYIGLPPPINHNSADAAQSLPPSTIIPPTLHSHLHPHAATYQNDKRTKPRNLPKSGAFLQIGQWWIENTSIFLVSEALIRGIPQRSAIHLTTFWLDHLLHTALVLTSAVVCLCHLYQTARCNRDA